jgi:hypothetical protein
VSPANIKQLNIADHIPVNTSGERLSHGVVLFVHVVPLSSEVATVLPPKWIATHLFNVGEYAATSSLKPEGVIDQLKPSLVCLFLPE